MDGTFLQGFIVSFREGLEAFLIMVILLKFLDKTNNKKFALCPTLSIAPAQRDWTKRLCHPTVC